MKIKLFDAAINGIKDIKISKLIYSKEYMDEMDKADYKIGQHHLNLRKNARKSKNFIANKGGIYEKNI